MRFLSICSGIEAASVAFHPLGWEALAFAEIEPFPCRLLAHHYPQVPNLGDLTRWREWSPELLAQADVLCGGTPCQAFSVAGLRGSLSDERGNLTLTFCHLFDEIDRLRHLHGRSPAVCLWENVPGVLNTNDNAFGHFLAGLAGEAEPLTPPGARWTDAGYVRGPRRAIAWRTLDAQYFGLAQRRERVFVVASADPAFRPEQVLFELDGLRQDTPPSRGPGEGVTAGTLRSSDGGIDLDHARAGHVLGEMTNEEGRMRKVHCQDVGNCLTRRMHKGLNTTLDEGQTPIVEQVCAPLTGNAWADNASQESKLVPEAFSFKASHFTRGKDGAPSDLAPPLSADADKGDQDTLVAAPIAFNAKDHGADATHDLCPTMRAGGANQSHANSGNWLAIAFPERLSGTQCASTENVSPVLQSHNPTAVAYEDRETLRLGDRESFAFDLRGREGGAMPEGPHPTANIRAGSGGSSRSYVAAVEDAEAISFKPRHYRGERKDGAASDICGPLTANAEFAGDCSPHVACQEPVAFSGRERGDDGRGYARAPQVFDGAVGALDTMKPHCVALPQPVTSQWRVRRLTPEECEILQGFPVGYTLIPGTASKQRKAADLSDTIDYLISLGVSPTAAEVLAHSPDGSRYKALGNSWAVPVARWIARRIEKQFQVPSFKLEPSSNAITPLET